MEGLRVKNPVFFRWLALRVRWFALLEVLHGVLTPFGALFSSFLGGLLAIGALGLWERRLLPLPPGTFAELLLLVSYALVLIHWRTAKGVLARPGTYKGMYLREGGGLLALALLYPTLPMREAFREWQALEPFKTLFGLVLLNPHYPLLLGALGAERVFMALAWALGLSYREEEAVIPLPGKGTPPKRAFLSKSLPTLEDRVALLGRLQEKLYLPREVAEEVVDLILLLRHYGAFQARYGKVEVPRGVLLYGPPGTGKTTLARFIAEEGGVGFVTADPSSMRSKWLGESASKIRDLFNQARALAPCVLFLDEMDAIAPRRGGHVEVDHAVAQLLTEMEGFEGRGGAPVVFIGATNHPRGLDPAVVSRMGVLIELPLPDGEGRRRILELKLKGVPHEPLDWSALVEASRGLSGRDLAEAVSRAARHRFARGGGALRTPDLVEELLRLKASR